MNNTSCSHNHDLYASVHGDSSVAVHEIAYHTINLSIVGYSELNGKQACDCSDAIIDEIDKLEKGSDTRKILIRLLEFCNDYPKAIIEVLDWRRYDC